MNSRDKTYQDLFSFYSPDDRNDFYIAYMYLKHLNHFMFNVMEVLGHPAVEPEEDAGDTLNNLLYSYVLQIAERSPSRETNIYHGKVMRHADARKLVTLDEKVDLRNSERVIPYTLARDIILEDPRAIAVGRCPCRAVQENPCIPAEEQEVCLIMGDPFASFVSEHNKDFRRCSQDEAVQILEKAHRRGDVHTAYFKKEMGNRLMALCNCCSCCCTGMVMWNKLNGAIPFLTSSGYTAHVEDGCTGCGECIEVCPFHAVDSDEEGIALVNEDKCMGCGVCIDSCSSGTITLQLDGSKGEPLDMDVLLERKN